MMLSTNHALHHLHLQICKLIPLISLKALVTRCVATNVKKPCRGVEFCFSCQQWHDNDNEPNKWKRDYEKSKQEEKLELASLLNGRTNVSRR